MARSARNRTEACNGLRCKTLRRRNIIALRRSCYPLTGHWRRPAWSPRPRLRTVMTVRRHPRDPCAARLSRDTSFENSRSGPNRWNRRTDPTPTTAASTSGWSATRLRERRGARSAWNSARSGLPCASACRADMSAAARTRRMLMRSSISSRPVTRSSARSSEAIDGRGATSTAATSNGCPYRRQAAPAVSPPGFGGFAGDSRTQSLNRGEAGFRSAGALAGRSGGPYEAQEEPIDRGQAGFTKRSTNLSVGTLG